MLSRFCDVCFGGAGEGKICRASATTRRSTPNGEGAMQKAVRKAEAANIEAIANAAASGKPAPASGVPKARAAVVVAEDHVAAPGRLMGDGGPSFARACPLL